MPADNPAADGAQSGADVTDPKTTEPTGTTRQASRSWNLWLAVFSLSAMLAWAVASAIVVAVSDDDEANTWKISPAVWLAIFSAGSNAAFGSALATGIAVRFWLHAARGAQLEQLHYIWDHSRGLGLPAALQAGPAARKVALMATLAYIVQFARGPLLQRLTHQANRERFSQPTMFVDLANRIPNS